MSDDLQHVLDLALQLSPREQLQLAERMLVSLEETLSSADPEFVAQFEQLQHHINRLRLSWDEAI